jgi:diaminohydroxyphosphoribosylaminopyrimidine deaminase/5-amino-6-(5-phosphoribosylamino)uracil reductase
MSRHLNLPSSANLWNTDNAQTVVLTKVGANPEFQALLYRQGVEVVELEPLTPNQVMTYFYNRGFCKVLWECGGILAANAIAQGAVQKVLAFIAPKIIGGVKAPGPVGNLGFATMNEALSLQCAEMHVIGSDFLITGYLPKH